MQNYTVSEIGLDFHGRRYVDKIAIRAWWPWSVADYTSAQRFAAFCEWHPQEWSFSAGNVDCPYLERRVLYSVALPRCSHNLNNAQPYPDQSEGCTSNHNRQKFCGAALRYINTRRSRYRKSTLPAEKDHSWGCRSQNAAKRWADV